MISVAPIIILKSLLLYSIGKSCPVTKPHSHKTDSRERRTRLAHERANKMRRSYTLQTNEQVNMYNYNNIINHLLFIIGQPRAD